jgi:two-component sensor histidine kinase
VKNTLALVIAICARTASNQDTIGGFQKAFTDRIHGLAATHTMLAEKSWSNLIIEDVLAAELKPFAGDGRVRTEGLGIEVAPRAAIALGLLFHELTTNAVKYGSLSVEGGHVTVRGEAIDGAGPFVLQWLESGGPEVAIPTHRGFGQTVIQRSLSYMPDGGTEIAFAPEGLRCTIRVPREDVTV